MASINKLSIRGVRSFSPDEKEQVIEFFYPVTVIVGANGCGKTTIIESLKYAVTGSLPPGNKAGQAFVHDPKSVGQSVVKANIKLRFTNRAGSSMVVSRSMEVQQKKTTLSFKALDGVLRTNDPETGERISMSHKCTELDRQIPTLMGVSKPILEHVVFCHQEDSSWPLQEGAVLQKRFDDIFDSTRYAKALVEIRNISKEYTGVAKDLKADLSGLSSHKHAAKGFRQELEQYTSQIEELEEEIVSCKEELKEVEAEYSRARKVAEKVGKAVEDLEEKRSELDRKEAEAKMQLNMLEENLSEKRTLGELKEMLSDFDEQMSDQVQRKRDLEKQDQMLRGKIQSYRDEEIKIQGQMGKLQAEGEAHQKLLQDRLSKMEQIAHLYNINLPATQTQTQNDLSSTQDQEEDTTVAGGTQPSMTSAFAIASEDMKAFNKALEQKEKELDDQLRQYRDTSQAAEDQIQSVLGDLMGKEKSIANDRNKIISQRQAARTEIDELSSSTSNRGPKMRKSEVEEAKRNVARINEERKALDKEAKESDIPIKIRDLEGKIDDLKRQIEDEDLILQDLRSNAEAHQAIAVLEEQATKQLEDLQETISEEESRFKQYNLDSPLSLPGLKGDGREDELVAAIHEWANGIEDKHNASSTELDKAHEKEKTNQKGVSETTALLDHNRSSLRTLKERMSELDESMRSFRQMVKDLQNFERNLEEEEKLPITRNESPQDLLDILTEAIEKLSTAEIKPQAFKKILNRLYLKRKVVKEDDSTEYVCPCCERKMDDSEHQVMQDAMRKLMDAENSPLLQARNKARADIDLSRVEKYQQCKADLSAMIESLKEFSRVQKEISTVEASVTNLEVDLKRNQEELDIAKGGSKEIANEVAELRDLFDLSKRWCEEAGRISEKRLQISSKHETSTSMSMCMPDTRDIKTVERDLNEKREAKDNMAASINRYNKEMTALNNKITQQSVRAEKMQQILRSKEARYAKEQEVQVRKTELKNKIDELDKEDKKLEDQLAPLRKDIQEKEIQKQRARSQAQDEEGDLSKSLSVFKNDVAALSGLTSQIDRYMEAREEDELGQLTSKLEQLKENVSERKKELKTMAPKLESLDKSVGEQQRRKKTIEDNITQFTLKESIDALAKEVEELDREIENIEGSDTYEKDCLKAQKRKTELLDSKARHEGRRGGIVDNVRSLKRKLQTPEYKDIDERHRVTMIKHETTLIAVSDLDKYYTALDKALMRFHGIKITEINKIIRELWTLTYKGEDITNIELVSGQDTGSRAKRSYNYRVVMTKGNTKLEMRGRCSAGQRVLACIVVRLALAETFCLNCGVIALDEPTVNLDYENKRGLAVALAQIIALRAQQNNFQLITITHDEEFVIMMKTELATHSGFDMPDRYFHVRREEGQDGKFYSKINAIDWDELA